MNSKKKMLHFIGSLDIGGEQTYMIRLINNLGTEKYNHCVVYSGSDRLLDLFRVRVDLTRLSKRRVNLFSIHLLSVIFKIAAIFKHEKPELVITYSPGIISSLFHWFASRKRVEVWHIPQRSFSAQSKTERIMTRVAKLRQIHYKKITKILALSDYYAEEYKNKWHIPEEKICLNYLGLELDQFSPNADVRQKFRTELEIDSETVVIGFLGRMHKQKGFDKCLRFYRELRKASQSKQIVLIAVGDGPLLTAYQRKCLNEKIDGVYFLGYRKDTPVILNGIDIYMQATDGPLNGISSIEAMACGKPIITFAKDRDEILMAQDTTKHGSNGFIVELDRLDQGVLEVLGSLSKVEIERMGQVSREIALAKFDIKQHIKRFESQI